MFNTLGKPAIGGEETEYRFRAICLLPILASWDGEEATEEPAREFSTSPPFVLILARECWFWR